MTQTETPKTESHNSVTALKSRGWIRCALVAAILPHVAAIVILLALWLTRAPYWDVIALISAFACLLLWAVGLGCLAKAYYDRSASDRLIYATAIMLGLSVPASLAYVSLMIEIMNSVEVTITNRTDAPLTEVSVRIADKVWPQPDIPAGNTVRKIIYFGSVRDSDIQLRASAERGPFTLADGYVPIGSPSEVHFEITDPAAYIATIGRTEEAH